MLSSVGIDRSRSGDREVSVNIFTGAPAIGAANPATSKHVALPSSGLTFRRLFLPNATKAVRQQVVAEELSYSLPFPLAEAHYGSVERGEEAWVVIAADSVVAPIRDLYPKAELEAEPLCYLRAAKAAGISTALVVDFGATRTVFCGIENGQVGTVRVLLRGGERLTDEIAADAGCPRDQAELLKREKGASHPKAKQFYLELVEEALLPSPIPYPRVLLCGGGSATNGLMKLLSEHWGRDVDVEPFPLPGALMPTDHVVAFGAALAGRPRSHRLNMGHSFHQTGRSNSLRLAPLFLTALLMVLMVVATETRLKGVQQKEQQLRESLAASVATVLPKAAELPPEEVSKALKTRLEAQKAIAQSSPTRLMSTMAKGSESVTSKKGATVSNLTFEDQKLKWEGRVGSMKDSEDIRTSLESVMSDVEQVRTRPTTNNSFVYQIEGRPREP